MPVYVFDVTVPAQTPLESPVESVFMLPVGLLERIQVFFPPGPQGEVKIRMLLNQSQVYPSETGQWIAWDAGSVDADLKVDVPFGENQVKIQAASPSANFPHVITIKLDVSTVLVFDTQTTRLDVTARMSRIMGGE